MNAYKELLRLTVFTLSSVGYSLDEMCALVYDYVEEWSKTKDATKISKAVDYTLHQLMKK